MTEVLNGLQGTVCLVDDILISAATEKEYTQWLYAVLNRIDNAGIAINRSKCQFYCSQKSFSGYVIDKKGLRPDPAKSAPLGNFPACKCVAEV